MEREPWIRALLQCVVLGPDCRTCQACFDRAKSHILYALAAAENKLKCRPGNRLCSRLYSRTPFLIRELILATSPLESSTKYGFSSLKLHIHTRVVVRLPCSGRTRLHQRCVMPWNEDWIMTAELQAHALSSRA